MTRDAKARIVSEPTRHGRTHCAHSAAALRSIRVRLAKSLHYAMEEPTASELLAQAHEEQELKEAANRRGDSKAGARPREGAKASLGCGLPHRRGARGPAFAQIRRREGADFVVKLYCMFTEYPTLIYWDDGRSW